MLIPRCQLHLESDSDSLESEQFFVMTCGRFYRDTGSFQKLVIKGEKFWFHGFRDTAGPYEDIRKIESIFVNDLTCQSVTKMG